LFNDFHPVFARDGKRLFFISNRRFDPTFCDFEWEMVYKKTSGIYCMTLQKDVGPFLSFRSDEESENKSVDEPIKKEKADMAIDFDGIVERVEALPLPRGNYRYLAAGESALFYLNRDEGDFNRFEFRVPETMTLYAYDFESREEGVVIQEINGYKLSADGSHIGYKQGDAMGIIASSARNSHGESLDLTDLKMWLDPKAEWAQIFNEAWRMERDFYYQSKMHGMDWDAMKQKYGQLIPYASCRQDIQFIVGELIGELNTSHTYVYGGDLRRHAEEVNVGMLGADYEVDEAANRYRFKKILSVPGWTRGVFPPLAKPGLNVQEGDYILVVNDEEVTADRNIYSYFQDLADKQVVLVINDKPTTQGAREIVVEPIDDENALRYLDWVEHNRRVVEKVSDGQIGYIHLPDTYTSSAREFPKYFYGQTRKKGLIIDGRFNSGGLDPAIFLQRLQKKAWSYWTRRYSHDQTSPQHSVNAHMVCLTNRQAGSGGDELPWEFQYFGMGPVIGTRSWGGLVGVSMFLEMIDGGGLTAPDYRIYDPDGKWIVENVGVQPDIVIDLRPAEMARGHDAQLMKGVKVLMERIERDPPTWPKHEPFPMDKLKE
jgi:tricorn protease